IFLPGDTLLIAVGVLVAQGHLPMLPALAVIFCAAILGDNVGYFIGQHTGKRIFKKQDGLLFKKAYARRAEAFFKKHGAKTVLIARFIPYVRTFTPIVAGVAKMSRGQFVAYNIISAFSWTLVTVFAGYWLGNKIPDISSFLLVGVITGILFVFAPTLWHFLGDPATRRRLGNLFHRSAQKR
ncbi:MAG TPA: DedA family protein, partial [Candidatus Saccharimonadales bacterium]|nr:DedA family protein [Candidatus Saccharimonadales bacterium]